jgi:hypothetical protein
MSTLYSNKSIIKVFTLIRKLVELNTKKNYKPTTTKSITTTTTTTKLMRKKEIKPREKYYFNIRLMKSKLNKLISKIKHYTKENNQNNYSFFYNNYLFKCFNININCTKIKKSIYKCNNYYYSKCCCCCCNSCCSHLKNMCNKNTKVDAKLIKKKFFELTDYHIANICIIIFISTLYFLFFYR